MLRLFAVFSVCVILFQSALHAQNVRSFEQVLDEFQNGTSVLGIGSQAPKLDIEHWYSNQRQPQKIEFTKDKVYIIEFWATWCKPCIAGMPHLAEIQHKFADRGVTVIGVSDETPETVEQFLQKKSMVKNDDGSHQTFGQLTGQYLLTSDPDMSTHEQYMMAAKQNGIPTAFIVGKTGLIEWVGSPQLMDNVLKQVLNNTWDRKPAAKEMRAAQFVQCLEEYYLDAMSEEDVDSARKVITYLQSKTDDQQFQDFAEFLSLDLEFQLAKIAMKKDPTKATQHLKAHFQKAVTSKSSTPSRIVFFSTQALLDLHEAEKDVVAKQHLLVALFACEKALNTAEGDTGILLNAMGNLHLTIENREQAIKYLTKAVQFSKSHENRNLKWFQDDLKTATSNSEGR